MSRYLRGQTLPEPPIVSQLHAVEPGGIIDPASTTDCGESCCSSVLAVASSYLVEPGCIREAMGLNRNNGSTSPNAVRMFLNATCGSSHIYTGNAAMAWSILGVLRRHGCYTLMLGEWLSPFALHWLLAFERSSDSIRAMDPWTAAYVDVPHERFDACYDNALVVCDLWSRI